MIARCLVAAAALLFSMAAAAVDLCPIIKPGVEWQTTCFEDDQAGRRVKQAYLKRLRPNREGFTTVMITEPRELVAVDKAGKVMISGIVHTGDFDFPNAHHGIGRFTTRAQLPRRKSATQCGYFDSRTFQVVVPAEYDHCRPFADGEAIACKHCESFCVEPDCKDSQLIGGEGVVLAPDGTVLRRIALPDAKARCAHSSQEHSSRADRKHDASPCAAKSEDPFNQLN